MSQENRSRAAKSAARRPIADQIVLRMPFLADFVLARLASLPPGSTLRGRLVPWGLRRGFEAVSRNDFDLPLLGYEPDVEFRVFGAAGLGFENGYEGHQGWLDFTSTFFETFVEPRNTVKRVLDAGDRWVAEAEFQGQGKASGVGVGNTYGTVYYLSPRGKIRRQDIFFEGGWTLALEAAGLSE
jgi:ketosteroid isomerase-like protein